MSAPTPPHHEPRPERLFSPAAGILAWLWPGLGHIRHGERRRGILIMGGVLFLFFSGLLVGGIDCVDRRHDRLWFLAQSLCGPIAFVADQVGERVVGELPPDFRDYSEARQQYLSGDEVLMKQLHRVSLGRVNEMGTLFIALAGLMNLVVILDALYYLPHPAPLPAERRAAP